MRFVIPPLRSERVVVQIATDAELLRTWREDEQAAHGCFAAMVLSQRRDVKEMRTPLGFDV